MCIATEYVNNHVRLFDDGRSDSEDRFTAVFMKYPEGGGHYMAKAMSKDRAFDTACKPGLHLGRRIKITDLPLDCRIQLLDEVRYLVR